MADDSGLSRYGMTPPKGGDDLWRDSLIDLTPSPSPIKQVKEAAGGGRTTAAPAVPLFVRGRPSGVEGWVPTEPSDRGDVTVDYGDQSMLGVAERELAV